MAKSKMNIDTLYNSFLGSTGVTTDSRKIEVGALFFALHGASFDGNDYAIAALEQGASAAVIDREDILEANPDYAERLILVDDTLQALQALAQEHRRRLAIPIIAIAGSNGKTTTKELVSRVLAEKFEVSTTKGNLNNHIGVPLTLLSMTEATEFGVVEMGASAQGEIALLCSIAEPNYGILTNIGLSHLEGFGGVEGIRKGKENNQTNAEYGHKRAANHEYRKRQQRQSSKENGLRQRTNRHQERVTEHFQESQLIVYPERNHP